MQFTLGVGRQCRWMVESSHRPPAWYHVVIIPEELRQGILVFFSGAALGNWRRRLGCASMANCVGTIELAIRIKTSIPHVIMSGPWVIFSILISMCFVFCWLLLRLNLCLIGLIRWDWGHSVFWAGVRDRIYVNSFPGSVPIVGVSWHHRYNVRFAPAYNADQR
jgi:hypothetical protein